MHGKQFLVREVHYGTDGSNLFVRLDFHAGFEERAPGLQARLNLHAGGRQSSVLLGFERSGIRVMELTLPQPVQSAAAVFECSWVNILELRLSLEALGVAAGGPVGFQFSLWRDGLPVDAVPQSGWLELEDTDPQTYGS